MLGGIGDLVYPLLCQPPGMALEGIEQLDLRRSLHQLELFDRNDCSEGLTPPLDHELVSMVGDTVQQITEPPSHRRRVDCLFQAGSLEIEG